MTVIFRVITVLGVDFKYKTTINMRTVLIRKVIEF